MTPVLFPSQFGHPTMDVMARMKLANEHYEKCRLERMAFANPDEYIAVPVQCDREFTCVCWDIVPPRNHNLWPPELSRGKPPDYILKPHYLSEEAAKDFAAAMNLGRQSRQFAVVADPEPAEPAPLQIEPLPLLEAAQGSDVELVLLAEQLAAEYAKFFGWVPIHRHGLLYSQCEHPRGKQMWELVKMAMATLTGTPIDDAVSGLEPEELDSIVKRLQAAAPVEDSPKRPKVIVKRGPGPNLDSMKR